MKQREKAITSKVAIWKNLQLDNSINFFSLLRCTNNIFVNYTIEEHTHVQHHGGTHIIAMKRSIVKRWNKK